MAIPMPLFPPVTIAALFFSDMETPDDVQPTPAGVVTKPVLPNPLDTPVPLWDMRIVPYPTASGPDLRVYITDNGSHDQRNVCASDADTDEWKCDPNANRAANASQTRARLIKQTLRYLACCFFSPSRRLAPRCPIENSLGGGVPILFLARRVSLRCHYAGHRVRESVRRTAAPGSTSRFMTSPSFASTCLASLSLSAFSTLPKLLTDAKQALRPNFHFAGFHRGERVLTDR